MMERILGIVIDNNDPEKRGRVKFRADEFLEGAEYPHWAEPILPPGCFLLPNHDELIEVFVPQREDVVDFPEYVFYAGRHYSDKKPVPDEFKENYPKRTGYKTKGGHVLFFDDTAGSETITLLHKSGSILLMKESGEIIAYDGSGEEPLVKKSELNDFITNDFNSHTHPLTATVPIIGPAGSTPVAGTAIAPAGASTVTGTAILKAK